MAVRANLRTFAKLSAAFLAGKPSKQVDCNGQSANTFKAARNGASSGAGAVMTHCPAIATVALFLSTYHFPAVCLASMISPLSLGFGKSPFVLVRPGVAARAVIRLTARFAGDATHSRSYLVPTRDRFIIGACWQVIGITSALVYDLVFPSAFWATHIVLCFAAHCVSSFIVINICLSTMVRHLPFL